MTYREKFLDPRWQKKRLEVFSRDKFTCCACGSSSETLHVHHAYYVKNRSPWEYPMWSFSTLCDECHKIAHAELEKDEEFDFEEWELLLESVFGQNPIKRDDTLNLRSLIGSIRDGSSDHSVLPSVVTALKRFSEYLTHVSATQ